jgi:hypothetical protein
LIHLQHIRSAIIGFNASLFGTSSFGPYQADPFAGNSISHQGNLTGFNNYQPGFQPNGFFSSGPGLPTYQGMYCLLYLLNAHDCQATNNAIQQAFQQPAQHPTQSLVQQPGHPPTVQTTRAITAMSGHGDINVERDDMKNVTQPEGTMQVDLATDFIAEYKKKSGKNKNQYWPNKPAAMTVWAKSDGIDAMIKTTCKLPSAPPIAALNKARIQCWQALEETERKLWEKKSQEMAKEAPDFGDAEYVCSFLPTSVLTNPSARVKLARTNILTIKMDTYSALRLPMITAVFAPTTTPGEVNTIL